MGNDTEKKPLTFEDIMGLIRKLARSQGLYGRLLNAIEEVKENSPEDYDELVEKWEWMQFKDELDFILYIES